MDTSSSVFGISIFDTDGIAVPQSAGLTGFSNGDSSFSSCIGSPTDLQILFKWLVLR